MSDKGRDGEGQPAQPAAAPLTQQVGRAAAIVAGLVFLAFAIANSHSVEFSWILGRSELVLVGGERVSGGIPLIFLLLASFAVGTVVGAAGLAWRRHRKGRRADHADEDAEKD